MRDTTPSRPRTDQFTVYAQPILELASKAVTRHELLLQVLDDVNGALIHKNVHITIDDTVVDWLLKRAEEEANSGARPLRRAIQRYVEDPLSEELIRGHLKGGEIQVYLEAGQLSYRPAGELEAGRKLA